MIEMGQWRERMHVCVLLSWVVLPVCTYFSHCWNQQSLSTLWTKRLQRIISQKHFYVLQGRKDNLLPTELEIVSCFVERLARKNKQGQRIQKFSQTVIWIVLDSKVSLVVAVVTNMTGLNKLLCYFPCILPDYLSTWIIRCKVQSSPVPSCAYRDSSLKRGRVRDRRVTV